MCAQSSDPEEAKQQTIEARKQLAEGLLKDAREELGRADGKATTLMSASGVIIGVLLAGAIAGRWNPTDLGLWQLLWWPGTAVGLAGVVAFAAAVWPRISHEKPKDEVAYFGHVVQYEKVEDFEAALNRAASSPSKDRTVDQLFVISKIVQKKYQLIQLGMKLLGVALVLCVLAVVLARLL